MGADQTEVSFARLARQLDDLTAREEIRTCLFRINRGLDRIDVDMLASGFFPDAKIRWASAAAVEFDAWLQQALAMQQRTQRVQHLLGNILISLNGDAADVESYEIGRHLTQMGEEQKDLIIAARYLDKFERRDGVWRIVYREKLVDWIRILAGTDGAFDNVAHPGRRDREDPSFAVFGAAAFHDTL